MTSKYIRPLALLLCAALLGCLLAACNGSATEGEIMIRGKHIEKMSEGQRIRFRQQ